MMKFLPLLLSFGFLTAAAQKQDFSLNRLVSFTQLPESEFSTYISRKGFKPQPDASLSAFAKTSKDKSIEKLIGRASGGSTASVLFQTTSLPEFTELSKEVEAAGFSPASAERLNATVYSLYQKGSIRIRPALKQEGAKTTYCFYIEHRQLPHPSEIVYAEDLLQLDAHEYLAAVFGEANVKKDVFYFSENEVSKCSILFPNTAKQVIFIWKDEAYNRNLSMLIIGGAVGRGGQMQQYRSVEWGRWKLKKGLYPGMTLKDLCQLNEKPVQFFGWESEGAGCVLPENPGSIDFRTTGVQLTCLDCNEDQFYSSTGVLGSDALIRQNRQVYVSTLILVPNAAAVAGK